MRRLAIMAGVFSAVIGVLGMMAEQNPIVLFGDSVIGQYLPPFGSIVMYLGWAVYFVLSVRESKWSAIAVGVLGFWVFCWAQPVVTLRLIFSGADYREQLPSILGHLALGFAARRQWKIHSHMARRMDVHDGAEVPAGLRRLAKAIGMILAVLAIYSLWLFSFHPFRVSFWSNPILLVTAFAVTRRLSGSMLRHEWRLPLKAGLVVALATLYRIAPFALAGTPSAADWTLVGLALGWTLLLAMVLARLSRMDEE